MPAYATQAAFEEYVEGWTTDNPATLARELERASRDVDGVLGPRPILDTGAYAGLKLDPTLLLEWEAAALSRATCAQAIYRIRNAGADGAPARRVKARSGPDFSETYADAESAGTGRYAPDVALELKPIRHLRVLSATARR